MTRGVRETDTLSLTHRLRVSTQERPMKFSQRLRSLGFASYADYLASETWKAFKQRYRESGARRTCLVCDTGPVQLHHHTYIRLGQEQITDVDPLCRPHHQAVHDWLKSSGRIFVEYTHEAITALSGRDYAPDLSSLPPRLRKRLEKKRRKKKGERDLWGWVANIHRADLLEVIDQLRQYPVSNKKRGKARGHARAGDLKSLRGLLEKVTTNESANLLAAERKFAKRLRKRAQKEDRDRAIAEKARREEERRAYETRKRSTVPFQFNTTAEPDRDSSRWKAFLVGRKNKEVPAVPV